MQKIRVKIKGYDHRVVDKATEQICDAVLETGAKIKGPVPLPNSKWMVAVHKGPHIDAQSKEHYGQTVHTRLVDILEPNAKTIETLTHMQLPAGVGIKIN
ncbi:MAG: 30S ribosomal protein S10 [Candidatus Dojkabacteria bacterium]|nr:30S ribosomal protein S10 [Candidatus Dojkabacteria bacterium]MDQ7021389.1 30S ribosomal protein S10 [Candidatus Dojkabacteria bacterium]